MSDENNKPICILNGPIGIRAGYSGLTEAIGKSLLRYDKFNLIVAPTKWGGCSRKSVSDIDLLEQELYKRVMKQPLTKQPEIFIQCDVPCNFQTPAKYNIGCTAGIESTVAAPVWISGLNKMNLNIVTSVHSKKVFEEAVYQPKQEPNQPLQPPLRSVKPIEVLFWGADTSIHGIDKTFEAKVEEELSNSIVPEDFNFLFVGQWCNNGLFNDRKDIGNLIKTFLITFSNMGIKPKPALIVKTSGAAISNIDKHDMITKLKTIRDIVKQELKTNDLPNVYILYGELTESEMNALYNHPKIKAHISFTHGEGFGNPLLLSTLSGKPLLVSNWSGHLDFLDPKLCKLLDGEVKQIPSDCVNEHLIAQSSWFTVNYLKAGEAMKNCFYYYKPHLEKAEELRIRNKEMFSTQAMDKKLAEILNKYVPIFPSENKLILPKLKKVSPSISNKIIPNVDENKIREIRFKFDDGREDIKNPSIDDITKLATTLRGKTIVISKFRSNDVLGEKVLFNTGESTENIILYLSKSIST